MPVVAGCDCFWLFWLTSGTQEASCSEEARMPIAECGRMVPAQWTYSAVATTGGVNVFPRALVTDQLGLVQGVQRLGQSIVIGIPLRAYRGDRLALGQD